MVFDYTSLTSAIFKLPSGWKIDKIKNVAKVNEACIQKDYKYEWIKYIDISSVDKGEIRTVIDLELSKTPSRAKRLVKDNDSLISTVRPNLEHYAFVKKAQKNYIASTGFAVITPKRIEPRYLYYYIISKPFTNYLSRIADSHTSAYPSFNPDIIKDAEIIIPSPKEQKSIAKILGDLDDMIELNRQMNETLEAMARAIFKSWFIDFDPVRAKAEGRDTGLPPDIADLFPDSFEEFELGLVPKGWDILPLSSIISIIGGGTPKTNIPEYWNGDIPWFSVIDAPNESDVFVIDTEKHITQSGLENSSTKILREGITIISARGTVGKCAIVGKPMAINQSCYGIQANHEHADYFIYFNLRNQIKNLQKVGHGSVFNTITRDTFNHIKIVNPSSKLTKTFDESIHSLMLQIVNNLNQANFLSKIRDELLPKLISGEIRVPDAEKFINEIL